MKLYEQWKYFLISEPSTAYRKGLGNEESGILPGKLKPWLGYHLSHEKYPGWLGYIGHYTTQLYRDYNKPL